MFGDIREIENDPARADSDKMVKMTEEAFEYVESWLAAHDQALKQKLLEALPEKKSWKTVPPNLGMEDAEARGHNQALSDVTSAIERVYGE